MAPSPETASEPGAARPPGREKSGGSLGEQRTWGGGRVSGRSKETRERRVHRQGKPGLRRMWWAGDGPRPKAGVRCRVGTKSLFSSANPCVAGVTSEPHVGGDAGAWPSRAVSRGFSERRPGCQLGGSLAWGLEARTGVRALPGLSASGVSLASFTREARPLGPPGGQDKWRDELLESLSPPRRDTWQRGHWDKLPRRMDVPVPDVAPEPVASFIGRRSCTRLTEI